MEEEKEGQKLGLLLRSMMKERSLSMRKMSTLTGMDTGTISRIINGKQPAKPHHLQRFSNCLGIPLETLFEAAGFSLNKQRNEGSSDILSSVDVIQKILESSKLFDQPFTTELVEKELSNYEKYAGTEEGQRIIREEFQGKVEKVGGVGPFIEQLKDMHQQFLQGNVTEGERAILGSAVLYFILSTDIIPDYIFPIGYLDDAIAVQLIMDRLSRMKDTTG